MRWGARIGPRPLGPSVELPVGHQTWEGCAKVQGGNDDDDDEDDDAELPVGHQTWEGCAGMRGVPA